MTIKDELLNLQAASGGLLKAEEAVAWASNNQESALYRSLEWDDVKAGHEYRVWQVRRLIAIHITTKEGVRQMVSLTIDRIDGGGYRDINAVISSPEMRTVMLADALAELDRVKLKYESLRELTEVWDAANRVRSRQARASRRSGAEVAERRNAMRAG